MKGTIEELTASERQALALWYDTESYRAFKKLMVLERNNTATKLVDISPLDVVSIARHQGAANFAKQAHLTFKKNYKAHQKIQEDKKTPGAKKKTG